MPAVDWAMQVLQVGAWLYALQYCLTCGGLCQCAKHMFVSGCHGSCDTAVEWASLGLGCRLSGCVCTETAAGLSVCGVCLCGVGVGMACVEVSVPLLCLQFYAPVGRFIAYVRRLQPATRWLQCLRYIFCVWSCVFVALQCVWAACIAFKFKKQYYYNSSAWLSRLGEALRELVCLGQACMQGCVLVVYRSA